MLTDIHKIVTGIRTIEKQNAFSQLTAFSRPLADYNKLQRKLLGFNNFDSTLQASLRKQSYISTIFGMSEVIKHLPSKYLYSDLAVHVQRDAAKHSGLAAAVVLGGLSSHLSSKYLIENIANSHHLKGIFYTQNTLSHHLSNISKNTWSHPHLKSIMGLVAVYNSVTTAVSVNAAAFKAIDELSTIEEVTARVKDTATEIYEKGYITKADIIQIKTEILDFLRKESKNQTRFSIFGIALTVFLFVLPYLINQNDSLRTSHDNLATKEDIESLREDIRHYQREATKRGVEKKLAADVNLRVNPTKKAYSICIVRKGTIITVLDITKDWAYISYTDFEDGFMKHGWISTKYFCKNTFSETFKERAGKR